MSVHSAPATITNGQCQAAPTMCVAALVITMISIIAQPMFCAMLSTVGTTDAPRPNRPRNPTIDGVPVWAPMPAAPPSNRAPTSVPSAHAASPPTSEPTDWVTSAPVSGPNRVTPNDAHMAVWAPAPRVRGGLSVSVSGASTDRRDSVLDERCPAGVDSDEYASDKVVHHQR